MKIWNNKKNTRRLYLFIALQFSMLFIMVLFVWISKLAINLNKVKTKNCNLKGVWDEIFNLYFIPWIKHIRAPNEHPKMVLQNFLNLRFSSLPRGLRTPVYTGGRPTFRTLHHKGSILLQDLPDGLCPNPIPCQLRGGPPPSRMPEEPTARSDGSARTEVSYKSNMG